MPSLPIQTWKLNRDKSWTVAWNATAAKFYRVVLLGQELARVTIPIYTYALTLSSKWAAFPPPLEIMEQNAVADSELNKPYLVIQWYRVQGSSFYNVEEFVVGNWNLIKKVVEVGSWVYTVTTPTLPDETTHQYRVVAFDALGQFSPQLNFQILVVTPPLFDESLRSVTYDGVGHNIVVA